MLKVYVFSLFMMMCVTFSYAHDSDKAYFDITTKGDQTIINAEFPWSIRNALIAFDSNFNNAKTIEEINDIVFNYTKEKIKLFDSENQELSLLKVILQKNNEEHNHATHYKFIFKGKDVAKVSNTIMLEHHKSQENFHWYKNENGDKQEINTNKNSTYFIIKEKSNDLIYYIIGAVLLIAGLVIYTLNKKK